MKTATARDTSRDQAASEFFRRFEPPPAQGDLCPSIDDLVSLARGENEDEFASHLSVCSHCNKLVEFLKASNPEVSLNLFLKQVRAEALKASPYHAPFGYLRGFLSNQPRTAYVALAALSVLLFVSWGTWTKLLNWQQVGRTQDASISFGEDKYGKTVQALTADLEDSKFSSYDREQLQQRINQINGNLSQLQGMNSNQRAELAELINQYNSAVIALNKPTRSTQVTSSVPNIAKNSDSEKVGDLYETIDQAMARMKSTGAVSWNNQSTSIVPASQQIDVVSLDDTRIVLADLLPNRSTEQQKAIQEGIKTFEDKNKMVVDFRPAFASRPASSWKGRN